MANNYGEISFQLIVPKVTSNRHVTGAFHRLNAPVFSFGYLGTRALQRPVGYFEALPTPEVDETPCIQHRHYRRGSCISLTRWHKPSPPFICVEAPGHWLCERPGFFLAEKPQAYGEFWDTLRHTYWGVSGHAPHETPYIQHRHFRRGNC